MPDIPPHRLRRILVSAIALPPTLITAVTITLGFQVERLLRASEWVVHSNEVLATAFEAEKLLIDTQSGLRGYLLTKDLRYLSPYQKGVERVNTKISELQVLVNDNKRQSVITKEILQISIQWQQHASQMLELSSYPLSLQRKKELNDRGKALIDKARSLFERFVYEENQLRSRRANSASNQAQAVLLITASGALIASLLLILGFSRILRALIKSYQEVLAERDAQTETLERRVQERTEMLARSNQDLQTFAYTLSHDIRSPISAISLFAQMLQLHSFSEFNYEWATKIINLAEWMEELTTDLLSYFTLNQKELEMRPINLQDLIENEVLLRLELLIEKRKPVFKIALLPLILGDHLSVSQIFLNFIGNAIKFVPSDRQPQIKIWPEYLEDQYVKIFIQDNGAGIDSRNYERIFQVFERLNPEDEGTGIGLAIAKKGAERNGGSVGVFSEEGKGATFWVMLKQA